MNGTDHRNDGDSTRPDTEYATFSAGESIVLYDTQNQAAWIQSDVTYDPEAMI